MVSIVRERVDGTKVRTMNVTCLEHFYEACKVRAIEEGIPVSRVLRVALQLGVIRLETEYSKQLRGEDNKVDKIREMYAQDGRMKKSTETRKSKKIDRKSTRLNSSHTDISRMPSSA